MFNNKSYKEIFDCRLALKKSRKSRFVIVGSWNTLVAWVIFIVLQKFFVPPLTNQISIVATYFFSVLNSYVMQRIFVWESLHRVRKELPKFLIVSMIHLLLNLLLIRFFVDYMDYPIFATQFAVTIFLLGLTYLLLKNWTFKRQ